MGELTLLKKGQITVKNSTEETTEQVKFLTGREFIKRYVGALYAKANPQITDKVIIIKAGTASGKSTVLPVAFGEIAKVKNVCLTVPTRMIAETTPASIIPFNKNMRMGDTIGYQTGVISRLPKKGLYIYTTAILYQQIASAMSTSEHFKRYQIILVDEAHTRAMAEDMLLAMLKLYLIEHYANQDCPLVVIMSATIDTSFYAHYFFDTPHIIDVAGYSFPIKEIWPEICVDNVITATREILKNIDTTGDALIFTASGSQINQIVDGINDSDKKDMIKEKRIMPLINLSSGSRERGDVPNEIYGGPRKSFYVLVATNTAETGVTIPDLKTVIDTGYEYSVGFNPTYGVSTGLIGPISRDSAMQRRGRVGRRMTGTWYPLYTKKTFDSFRTESYPEIYKIDISDYLMKLICFQSGASFDYSTNSISIKRSFNPNIDFISPISFEAMAYAYEKLNLLGMIEPDWMPTLTGYISSKLTAVPLECVKMILSGVYWKAPIMSLIRLAACITVKAFTLKIISPRDNISVKPQRDDAKNTIVPTTDNDFINLILLCEAIEDKINTMKNISPRYLKEWFRQHNLVYEQWLKVFTCIDTCIDGFASVGLKFPDSRYKNTDLDSIQLSLIDSFRMNIFKEMNPISDENKPARTFIRLNRAIKLNSPIKNKYFLTDTVSWIGNKFKVGLVCPISVVFDESM